MKQNNEKKKKQTIIITKNKGIDRKDRIKAIKNESLSSFSPIAFISKIY